MIEIVEKIVASVVVSLLLCLSTVKMLGIMQQGAYKNTAFWKWLKRKDNLLFNRLAVLSLCLALATAVTSLCFSFLGVEWALLCSALPFFVLLLGFLGGHDPEDSFYVIFHGILQIFFISYLLLISLLSNNKHLTI